jgi:hypothetical protein
MWKSMCVGMDRDNDTLCTIEEKDRFVLEKNINYNTSNLSKL